MTRSLLWLFAIAAGAAVGNLYYVQPLLDIIARGLHAGQAEAGLLVTATQLGYATGIVFIVPLGDVRDRRRLAPLMMLLSAAALAACAAAPNIVVLAIALVAVGVTTVAGQILTPFAGDLADDGARGRVVGIVVSGLLIGILAARIVSGLIADVTHWRVVFAAASVLMVVLAVLLYRMIPEVPAKTSASYGSLLRSMISLVRHERTLRTSMAFGIVTMTTFTLFWTALTFLLSGSPYHYSPTVIGLFGLAGLIGSLAAQGAGRVHDRGWSGPGIGAAWLLAMAAWAAAGLGGHSLAWLLVGIVALDIAIQSQRILNVSQIFTVSTEARSRVNTAYVAGNFIGGTAGSIAVSVLWPYGGWDVIVLTGGSLSLAAFLFWLVTRFRSRTGRAPHTGSA